MVKLIGTFIMTTALLSITNVSFAWGTCEIEFTGPETPAFQCGETSKEFLVEARIITDKPIDPDAGNCKWWTKGVRTEALEREGDVCRAKVTITKPELNWVKVRFKSGFGTNPLITECDTVGRLDVQPLCCTPL